MVRRTAYDKANRPLSKTLEDFVHYDGTHRDVILESQQYDAAGHVVVQVKGGGKQRTASVYDAAGRVTCATLDPAGVDRVLDMMYDPNGNVLSRSLTAAGRTETTRFTYDTESKALTQTVETGAADLTTRFEYDDRGLLLVCQTDPRGSTQACKGRSLRPRR